MEDKVVISTLNSLIETCNDGAKGFREAADSLKDASIKQEFQRFGQERAQFVSELQAEVARLGGSPDKGGSMSGAMHRGWMNLKSAVTGKDDAAIIAEAERGEDVAMETYEKAMRAGLPLQVQVVVQKQFARVKAAHDRVRELERVHTLHK
jgi:uncharacterized protein (TIGR02284 family)